MISPENYFIIGYCLGGILTWILCYEYMRRFKVDKQFGELIYLKYDTEGEVVE